MKITFAWRPTTWRASLWGGVVVVAVLCTGCSHGQPAGVSVSAVAGTIEPLASLRGVQLGAVAESVRTLRPNTDPSPYVGLAESLGGDSVFYRFAGSVALTDSYLSGGDAPVASSAILTSVEAWIRPSTLDSISFEKWLELKAELTKLHGVESECFLIPRAYISWGSWGVSWGKPAYELTLLFDASWSATSQFSGRLEYPPLVRLAVHSRSPALPGLGNKASAPCPTSWSGMRTGGNSAPP